MRGPFRDVHSSIYLRADYNAFSLTGNFTINFHYTVNKVFPPQKACRVTCRLMTFRTVARAFTRVNNSCAIDATQKSNVNRAVRFFTAIRLHIF